LAFIEGANVMTTELLGAKILAPVFGTSLYVWASTLAITLLALMLGYYYGGHYSSVKNKVNAVYVILILAGFGLIIMPFLSALILPAMVKFSLTWGSIIALMLYMFPALFLMGMSSPIIIHKLTSTANDSGKTAGKVYAISTLGGVISTFVTGFYFLPELGIKITAFVFGALLVTYSTFCLITEKKKYKSLVIILPLLFFSFSLKTEFPNTDATKVIYHSEGVLGQIKVVDNLCFTQTRGRKMGRSLLVNNTGQTTSDLDNLDYDLWDFAYFFPAITSNLPPKSKVLLMGLGGGTLVKQFNRLKFDVEVVEIDKRVRDVAIEYFNLDPKTKITIDDARHYLISNTNKYDVITFDMFLSETPPAHLFTTENFTIAKDRLTKNGFLLINFYGFLTGELGRPSRSVIKTLQKCGYNIKLVVTPSNDEMSRNLIIVAAKNKLPDVSNVKYSEPNVPVITNLDNYTIAMNLVDLNDADVLTDDLNNLEKDYIKSARAWREGVNYQYTFRFMEEKFPIFK
jgi:spermidine synthase